MHTPIGEFHAAQAWTAVHAFHEESRHCQVAEHPDRQEETLSFRGDPAGAFQGDASAGDEAVQVRVMLACLSRRSGSL